MLDVRVDAGGLAVVATSTDGSPPARRHVGQRGGVGGRVGATARVHGRVGDDVVGRLLRTELEVRGVEASLVADAGRALRHDARRVRGGGALDGGRSGSERRLGAGGPPRGARRPVRCSCPGICCSRTERRRRGSRRSVGRSPRGSRWKRRPWPLVEAIGPAGFHELAAGRTVVLANEREAEELTSRGPVEAASELGERYRAAAVKRGAAGPSMVARRGGLRSGGGGRRGATIHGSRRRVRRRAPGVARPRRRGGGGAPAGLSRPARRSRGALGVAGGGARERRPSVSASRWRPPSRRNGRSSASRRA